MPLNCLRALTAPSLLVHIAASRIGPSKHYLRAVILAAGLGFTGVGVFAADNYSAIKQALSTGETERALTLLDKAKSEHPKDVQLMFFEGVIKAQMGDTRAAIALFEDMAQKYPELPEPHNNLGVLYAARGELERAKASFERAILTNPAYAAAHKNVADVYAALAKKNYGKALQVDAANAPKTPQMTLLGNLTPGASAKDAVLIASSKAEPKPEPTPAAKPDIKPQPTPQVTAAAAVKPAPVKAQQDQINKDVERSVMAWASAWSKREITGYLASYSKDFDAGRMPLSDWKQQRTERIVPRKRINVGIAKLTISVNGSTATADFEQNYTSDTFNGSSNKRLNFALEGSRWLIVKESVR